MNIHKRQELWCRKSFALHKEYEEGKITEEVFLRRRKPIFAKIDEIRALVADRFNKADEKRKKEADKVKKENDAAKQAAKEQLDAEDEFPKPRKPSCRPCCNCGEKTAFVQRTARTIITMSCDTCHFDPVVGKEMRDKKEAK